MRTMIDMRVRLTDDAPLPMHARPGDAGLDLTSREDAEIAPGETVMVRTGVSVEIPEGWVGLVFPRSGLGARGLTLGNCVGVIDSSYRGEIHAPLHNNHSAVQATTINGCVHTFMNVESNTMRVRRGDRVCQLVIVPCATVACVEAESLGDTDRGTDGFGSTGVR